MEERHYRIKAGYSVEKVAGENILIAPAVGSVDYSKMLVLSDSAAFVARLLIEKALTFEDIIKALGDEYEADEKLLRDELSALLDRFSQLNVLA